MMDQMDNCKDLDPLLVLLAVGEGFYQIVEEGVGNGEFGYREPGKDCRQFKKLLLSEFVILFHHLLYTKLNNKRLDIIVLA